MKKRGASRSRAPRAMAPAVRVRGARRLLARLVLRVGRTVVGILPFARRVRAANDPKA